jgi:hypothetical protein
MSVSPLPKMLLRMLGVKMPGGWQPVEEWSGNEKVVVRSK